MKKFNIFFDTFVTLKSSHNLNTSHNKDITLIYIQVMIIKKLNNKQHFSRKKSLKHKINYPVANRSANNRSPNQSSRPKRNILPIQKKSLSFMASEKYLLRFLFHTNFFDLYIYFGCWNRCEVFEGTSVRSCCDKQPCLLFLFGKVSVRSSEGCVVDMT
ncbi:hypothetical protein BpHYR1_042549 [Brachionus plicatilis]|uniref:Uncharacterized protein n=1 Tax=Brachionus plicatilis TaxID=10195 RepID=A0A3M7Q461_BRAPC|nr:hypothetical protein BpHYR1_042549 [Brachionus plicatilis]